MRDRNVPTMTVRELIQALQQERPEDFVYLHEKTAVVRIRRELTYTLEGDTPNVIIKGPRD